MHISSQIHLLILAGIYTAAMFYLPNREYYPLLKDIDEAGLRSKIMDVLIYVMVELVSLLVIGYVIQHKLRISMLQVLSFGLDKSWRMVQSNLHLWIFFTVESSIEHSGKCMHVLRQIPVEQRR